MKTGPKYEWFKISYLEFVFFENIRAYSVFIFLQTFQLTPSEFFFLNFRFSCRKSQSQQKLAKKITHFTIQFCSKNLTHFTNLNSFDIENNMLSQHSQKPLWLYKFYAKHFSVWCQKSICTAPFLDAQERHSWSTLKRNLFFSRRSKVLSGKG